MSEANNPQRLFLASAGNSPVLSVVLSILLFVMGLVLIFLEHSWGWALAICSALWTPALVLIKRKTPSGLNLAYQGFTIYHAGQNSSFMWSDIAEFLVSGDRSDRYVAFTLSESGKKRCSSRNIFLSSAGPKGIGSVLRLPELYGQRPDALRAILIEWQKRAGQRS